MTGEVFRQTDRREYREQFERALSPEALLEIQDQEFLQFYAFLKEMTEVVYTAVVTIDGAEWAGEHLNLQVKPYYVAEGINTGRILRGSVDRDKIWVPSVNDGTFLHMMHAREGFLTQV